MDCTLTAINTEPVPNEARRPTRAGYPGHPPPGMTCPLDPLNSKAGAPPVRANPSCDAPAIPG